MSSDPNWDPQKKAWRMEPPSLYRRRAPKDLTTTGPRLNHLEACACGHRKRDHDSLLWRCWVCGTGRGDGCQKFRSPEAQHEVHP